MSDDASVQGLRDSINVELDYIEKIEAWAAEISQTLDQITPLHQLVFAASSSTYPAAMSAGLETIKHGIEEVYQGLNAFRDEATVYLREL